MRKIFPIENLEYYVTLTFYKMIIKNYENTFFSNLFIPGTAKNIFEDFWYINSIFSIIFFTLPHLNYIN